ncbi:hypothetical protein A2U01_0050882, partial [Trifolium medium]|nr:hypothetical protein [Trifolium medium]
FQPLKPSIFSRAITSEARSSSEPRNF